MNSIAGTREHGLKDIKNGMKKKLNYLKTKTIKMAKGLVMVWLCVMWLILLPFVWLFDRAFGGWK